MASIVRDPGGRRRILLFDRQKKRRTIHLGKVPQRDAETIRLRIEAILAAQLSGRALDHETAFWVGNLSGSLAEKLARAGLVQALEVPRLLTLGELLDNYFAKRGDVKPSTLLNWQHTRRCLLAFFGDERPLGSITPGDARDFERWLRTAEARENRYAENPADSGLAPNTARKRISNAKQFFQDAVNRELIARNPFAGLKGTVGSNRKRDHFVPRADAEAILAACPDAQWRLMFALARFGGLRVPSELLALRWAEVDWERGRLLVRSPKTEHHEGKGSRWVPIFPELKPYLEAAWDAAEPGADFVITRYRDPGDNLRTQLARIIRRAGRTPWPKLWQNLRATRATELAAEHPAHVAAAWLGHSTTIATRHYWQVTEADFERATRGAGSHTKKLAQNPAQQATETGGNDPQREKSAHEKTPVLQGFSAGCDELHTCGVGDTRLELVTPSLSS